MKLINIVPFALFILSTPLACSDDSGEPSDTGSGVAGNNSAAGTGGSANMTSGGAMNSGTAGMPMGGTGGTAMAGSGGMGDDTMVALTEDSILQPGLNGIFSPLRAANSEDTGSFKYNVEAADVCPAEGSTILRESIAQGDPAQAYQINFELRGALALHCYSGGTPLGMSADPAGINQAFYMGGAPSGDSTGTQVVLTVSPDVPTATANTYYLNGIPAASGTCDEGITYDVQYKGSFTVMGGSTVTLGYLAPECQALQNCGADPASCAPREIDVSGVEVRASAPQPVSDPFFVGDEQVDLFPQWLVFDIQSIDTL